MAVGAASFVHFGLEDIQWPDFFSVWVGGLFKGQASGNCLPDEADPLFRYETDSGHAAVVVLI
jgi:hypothetical protein